MLQLDTGRFTKIIAILKLILFLWGKWPTGVSVAVLHPSQGTMGSFSCDFHCSLMTYTSPDCLHHLLASLYAQD
jgi:hypothetical protein